MHHRRARGCTMAGVLLWLAAVPGLAQPPNYGVCNVFLKANGKLASTQPGSGCDVARDRQTVHLVQVAHGNLLRFAWQGEANCRDYTWSFGDGWAASGDHGEISHRYAGAGEFPALATRYCPADNGEQRVSMLVHIQAPQLKLEHVGRTRIDPALNYAEVRDIRLSLHYPKRHPRHPKLLPGYPDPIHLEEWATRVYDGRFGATALPMSLTVSQGKTEITLVSLAAFAHRARRNSPVPQIHASVHGQATTLLVPQWVDVDGDGTTDWLQVRVNDILARARGSGIPEVVAAVDALAGWQESWKTDCGGVEPDNPYVIEVSTACIDDQLGNAHRLDADRQLTATVLHEAYHVVQIRNASEEERHRIFEGLVFAAPASSRTACDGDDEVSGEISPGCYSTRAVPIGDDRFEKAAEEFSEKYKRRIWNEPDPAVTPP